MGERLFLQVDGVALAAPGAAVADDALGQVALGPAVAAAARAVLTYRESIPDGVEVMERVLPDGESRLLVHDAPDGEPRVELVGPSLAPVLLSFRGEVRGLSVTLATATAGALAGVPPGELRAPVPVRTLWGDVGARLVDALARAKDDHARARAIEDALAARLRAVELAPARVVRRAARLLDEAEGRLRPAELAARLGLGERRLQQLFSAHVGLSPRDFARIVRLETCVRALRDVPSTRGAALAARAGFYDQAHLVNELRALSGLTPSDLGRRLSSVPSKPALPSAR